jgi:RNA polymerase sigma-70 factor, ECF subfamily
MWLSCDPPLRYACHFLDPAIMAAANKGVANETSPLVDRKLLAAFRDGQRDALERIYREHVHEVAGFLRRGFMYTVDDRPSRYQGARDSLELESLVQEVFVRAFEPRARSAYDGVRPYAGFLIGIARNVVLDQLRRLARHGEVFAAPDVIDALPAPTTDEPSVDERRGHELVAAFLETCDERDRRLYELRYVEELSQADAAARAGLTRIQVRRWETKFRARLLRHLKRADYVREPA